MNKIEPGSIVILKTGGPRMTVINVNRKGKCSCAFFVGDGLHRIKLPMDSLENVTEISYDEATVLPEKKPFDEIIQHRDDSDATNLVDDSTMVVLTKYIKEDQPMVLARIDNEIIFSAAIEEADTVKEV
jgi:uncharacterized protein YodC (DUF2158 family)